MGPNQICSVPSNDTPAQPCKLSEGSGPQYQQHYHCNDPPHRYSSVLGHPGSGVPDLGKSLMRPSSVKSTSATTKAKVGVERHGSTAEKSYMIFAWGESVDQVSMVGGLNKESKQQTIEYSTFPKRLCGKVDSQ